MASIRSVKAPFSEMLRGAWNKNRSMLCVGLDPDPARLPRGFEKTPEGVLAFCLKIVDSTAHLVCAYKPQIACFSAFGMETVLATLIEEIHARHPGIPVILDAKRGDIGSTADWYAKEAFVRYGADAVTVNPFVGWECVSSFTRHEGKGVVVLCRTSNDDADWLQSAGSGEPVYLRIAKRVRDEENPELALVVGATAPPELAEVRNIAPDVPLLVPGIGAQGGRVEEVLAAGMAYGGAAGLVVNASRSILYASSGSDWAEAATEEALRLATLLRIPDHTQAT